jgi:hypothetical protein
VRWTLGYEADGSDMAAWTVRLNPDDPDSVVDSTVYEVTDKFEDGDVEEAQAWAAEYLRGAHAFEVDSWEPHSPGPWSMPDYYTAVEAD